LGTTTNANVVKVKGLGSKTTKQISPILLLQFPKGQGKHSQCFLSVLLTLGATTNRINQCCIVQGTITVTGQKKTITISQPIKMKLLAPWAANH
jgi:hypothetical protein